MKLEEFISEVLKNMVETNVETMNITAFVDSQCQMCFSSAYAGSIAFTLGSEKKKKAKEE